MSNLERIDVKKKLVNYKKNKGKILYAESRRKDKIKKRQFVLESTHGDAVGGHIFYLIEEIQKQVPDSKVFVASKRPEEARAFLNSKEIQNVNIVKHLSIEYYELLAVSEYLINDTTFYPFFNKREGQKYYIVWHGTPLKNMGKDTPNVIDVANVQRNFYMADKIIVSNEATKDILINSHNLKNIYKGKIVVGPSPRNSVFFDKTIREEIRDNLSLNNKKVICYMPTWRGTINKVEKTSQTEVTLKYLDKILDEDTVLYVKLHDFEKNSIKTTFRNIHFFPQEYETYEFLTATDSLITDYSSVMYDYLNLDKPIILYTYDLEEYAENRGLYEPISAYPFTVASTLEELASAIENIEHCVDYHEMKAKFAKNDCILGPEKIVKNMVNGYIDESITEYYIHNGKETVAILSGGFWNNGVTTALINTLENIDTNKRNYICFFEKSKIKPEHYYRLLNLPENVLFYPTTGEINGTISDRLLLKKYLWNEDFSGKLYKNQLRRIYREEFARLFGDIEIDWFIHYTGFERKGAEMMRHIDAKKAIWVHTDMFEEFRAKRNFSRKIVFGAYQDSDKIVMVQNNLRENLANNIKGISGKLVTVNNFLGENRTKKLGQVSLFKSLEDVKVDYSFNDNAYKTINQTKLEQLKSEMQELFNTIRNTKNIDYKVMFSQIKQISLKYKGTDYLNDIIDKEMKTLDEAFYRIKNIFGEYNENLIYRLVFKEFEEYILPNLGNNRDELHYYFPELENKLYEYKESIESKLINVSSSENNENWVESFEKQFKDSEKIILENYRILKWEKDLTFKFSSLFEDNIQEVENFINNEVLLSSKQLSHSPVFDFYRHFRISKLKTLNALFDDEMKVYINIGRYDYQKGHDKLIEAFEHLYEDDKNIFLVLICPHGPLKSKTIDRARNSNARENIVILGGMNNPYPLLAYCDAFVLSSNYEGLGLVVYEALALGTDVVTVDLPETIQYLDKDQAIIVPNNVNGLIDGLYRHAKRQPRLKPFDFEPLRNKSAEEFESVFQ